MSAMLTADWFLLGHDVYYRKFEIYTMEWQQEVNMENVIAFGAQYGGPIAVIRDKKKFVKIQGSGKPVIAIYSGSGKQISSLVWNRSQLMSLGWSQDEDLLCMQDDGSVVMYDMFGGYKHSFSIIHDVHDSKVIDARVFNSPQGSGVAVLTTSCKVHLVNNVCEPKTRQLADVPRSNVPPSCWTVICANRRTDVLLARDRDLFMLDEQHCRSVQPVDVAHEYTAVLEMAVSLNGKHVALFTDAGYLWLGSSNLRTKYREFATECRTRPRQLVWCGTEAVVAHWETTVIVADRQHGECSSYAYDGPVHLVPEIDGVRVLSSSQHELVQRVPPVVQKIFRINSTEPGSFLLEASKQYQRRSHRADEYIALVRTDLELAVRQCIEAAAFEFDTDTQKMLIRAAQFGKCFLTNANPKFYVDMCRLLRVLNAIRDARIGLPLTYTQVLKLTYKTLLDRLVGRKHYYLAIQAADYLKLPEQEGTSRILSHWAEYKVAARTHLDDDVDAKEIADKLGHTSGVSYSQIAQTAANNGRRRLAIRLLDYEPRASLQVPLLLTLGECKPALLKAIESGDTDLTLTVILHMRDNMPLADFRMTIRNFPVAQALYKKYCKQHSPQVLSEIHIQEDDFNAQAKDSLVECLLEQSPSGDPVGKDALLAAAHESYRKARNDFGTSLCDEAQKLRKAQKQFETTYKQNFVGLSVHDTCARLLALSDIRAAERFRSDFRIPERRFWWLRVRALAQLQNWADLEQLAKTKKPPIGFGPFVDVCLEQGKPDEAAKYLPKINDDLKFKYYVKAGKFEEAARLACEQRDPDALLYVQRRCGNGAAADKVNMYVTQLNTRK